MLERTRHYSTVHKRDLTPRQTEVLRMIAAGRTNPEIAEALGITLDGAKFHVREILGKLGVDSREEAAAWWRAQDGVFSGAARGMRGLLPAGWLKMSLAATGAAGLVLGTVVVTLAFNGGTGDDSTALAALEDLPACNPAALDWSTDAVLDADPATGARFTISAGSARDCVLRGDFEVAYGGSVAGPRPLQGGSVTVAVDGQRIGQSPSPVIVGTASNVCGSNLSVLAVLSQGAGIYWTAPRRRAWMLRSLPWWRRSGSGRATLGRCSRSRNRRLGQAHSASATTGRALAKTSVCSSRTWFSRATPSRHSPRGTPSILPRFAS